MKKFTLIALVFLFVFISIVSCNSEPKYTAEEWEERTFAREDTEKISKINDFSQRLEDCNKYIQEVSGIITEYDENINKLTDKLLNQTKGREDEPFREEDKVIQELIRDEYNEYFNKYSLLTPPEQLNDYHFYYLDYLKECKLMASWFVNNMLAPNYNPSEGDNIAANRDLANAKSSNELNQLMKSFNQEAKELGLQLPFPGVE